MTDETELRGCQKGCCMKKATRVAAFVSASGAVELEACDRCGGETVRELGQAAAARAWNAENDWTD